MKSISRPTSPLTDQQFNEKHLLERNSSFYSRAAQQRRQVASSRGRSGSRDDLNAPSTQATATADGTKTAAPLQRILEDYLEVDSTMNARLKQLLRSELLSRYFYRTTFPALEVIFDTDEPADRVIYFFLFHLQHIIFDFL